MTTDCWINRTISTRTERFRLSGYALSRLLLSLVITVAGSVGGTRCVVEAQSQGLSNADARSSAAFSPSVPGTAPARSLDGAPLIDLKSEGQTSSAEDSLDGIPPAGVIEQGPPLGLFSDAVVPPTSTLGLDGDTDAFADDQPNGDSGPQVLAPAPASSSAPARAANPALNSTSAQAPVAASTQASTQAIVPRSEQPSRSGDSQSVSGPKTAASAARMNSAALPLAPLQDAGALPANSPAASSFSLPKMIASLLVLAGLFALWLGVNKWFIGANGPKNAVDELNVLGQGVLLGKTVYYVETGKKILVIVVNSNGLETLTEICETDEVSRIQERFRSRRVGGNTGKTTVKRESRKAGESQ